MKCQIPRQEVQTGLLMDSGKGKVDAELVGCTVGEVTAMRHMAEYRLIYMG